MDKRFVFDLSLEDWITWVKERGFPRYRAAQIYQWFVKGIQDTSRMKNIPDSIRTALSEDYILQGLILEKELTSSVDGTKKFIFQLHDGHRVETVLMKYKTGYSLCISSQAGCRMGCAFCASAHAGFGRDLTSGEMLGQITVVSDIIGDRIHSVVVMGIGEPFDNYDNLMGFLRAANDPEGLNLGARHITVSTCGIVPQMIEFISINLQVNLSVSLHASRDILRRSMMPVAKQYDLDTLLDACRQYVNRTGRRITFEYSLFHGINDSIQDARDLAGALRGIHCHINLIAANEFEGSPYKRSSPEHVRLFQQMLEQMGMTVTLRREMGTDIMAACGQLRRGMQESEQK
ncbi:MAG: 23S rRNA (adenine(2503)-C(2))-methyltransferase RlmN [Eubacteriales bacterium]